MAQIKMITRLFSVSILLFSLMACGGSKTTDSGYVLQKKAPFLVKKVWCQDWVAGTPEGGSGTNFNLDISILEGDVELKEIYFRNKITKAQTTRIIDHYMGYFKNEAGQDRIMDSEAINEASNVPPVPFPFNLDKDEAVVGYTLNGVLQYYKITDVIEKPLLAYPKSNPDGID